MKLRNLLVGVPGGWRYRQSETGFTITGVTFFELIKRVGQHRVNNGIAVSNDLAAELEDEMCQAMCPQDQVEYCENGPRFPQSIHWKHVDAFLKTAAAYVAEGAQPVPQEEAERRASICADCPYNVPMHGCALCQVTINTLRTTVLQGSTEQDARLRNCAICGCDNKAQVHLPIEILRAGTGGVDYSSASWCWKLKGGENESKV